MTPEPKTIETEEFPVGGRSTRSSVIRRALLLALLLLILALVVWATVYYMQNRRLPIPRLLTDAEEVLPPEYLYSIAGPQGESALTRPVGVAVGKNDYVYATDTQADVIRVYTSEGRYRFSFGAIADGENTALQAPAHLAVDANDNIYVSDRRLRAIYVFASDGTYLRRIAPTDEKAKVFGPFGMAFDTDGNLYVTDVGETLGHQIVVFDPQGVEIERFGSTGRANQMTDFPGLFYFPNGIVLDSDSRLLVGDSNNRRVQVFGGDKLSFEYFIQTSGIPRGMVIDDSDRLYVVDALAHAVDVYALEGDRIVSFGREGVGPGQFRYANDVALDSNGRIYVSDRENNQIQVWAWPEAEVFIPGAPTTGPGWALCASPLLLLPLLLLLRRKRFAVTVDFIDELVKRGEVESLRRRRSRFVTTPAIWASLAGRVESGIELDKMVHEQTFSDSDARDLVERLSIDYNTAALLVVAQRARRLCTEDVRLASFAGALGVETMDTVRYLERYGPREGAKKVVE